MLTAKDIDRFWSHVDRTEECWLWQGSRLAQRGGYGLFGIKRQGQGRTLRAHRVAYEISVGPIPDGLDLDHLCRIPACVRPDHLEPVTRRVNTLRGKGPTARNAVKTRCANGHEFTPENTYVTRDGRHRACRTCGRERKRACYRRCREEVA
jgi:hypothetical protein